MDSKARGSVVKGFTCLTRLGESGEFSRRFYYDPRSEFLTGCLITSFG
ncbi:hypothetical protein C943_02456 [Mariniradius saccharolyticus AK6]|uniref:Uncharacterized protein n=1 Tax=Mariniradius saccharolyticus AK6 TaxID=1239962 RepID=M7X8M1_9BACT|nr:hypothetical protein C943_02456 [Mariniradius saccharolyticus AK6]